MQGLEYWLNSPEARASLSPVARSCIRTMVASGQGVPLGPVVPDEEIRRLRAKLILEECLETIEALGFRVASSGWNSEFGEDYKLIPCPWENPPDARPSTEFAAAGTQSEAIIDGCCDTVYVAIGTLIAMGVCDMPHLSEVCRANDEKFPGGKAVLREDGKFLKPDGWRGPDHVIYSRPVAWSIPKSLRGQVVGDVIRKRGES